ncbi:MAG: hypothetical protein US70_C0013G0023 [Parcubacteria group bacterium GW2011_GWD2_38_11]|nr:MAG: hypothetical protein US70_C0013G0023 [Parcubacteria group bacterium GW2011_GWD2_38_11]
MLNVMLIAVGVLFMRQKNTEKADTIALQEAAQNYKEAADYALDAQQRIKADGELKIGSIANNADTIQKEQVVPVTRTIPAVTKTVTVEQPSKGSSSSTSTKSTPAKTTTKAS